MKHILLFIFLCPTFLGAQTESIFWKIEGGSLEEPAYLFGTYHLINHGFLDSGARSVNVAYLQADRVIVESVFVDSTDQKVLENHLFCEEDLSEDLSAKDYAVVDSIFQLRLGQELTDYDFINPMITGLILGMEYHNMYLSDHGNYIGDPIDKHFQDAAQAKGIEVIGLESAEESYAYLLDSVERQDQIQILVDIAYHDDKIYQISGDMYEYYRVNQPTKILEAVDYYHTLVSDAGMELLTEGRNELWMTRLPEMLKPNTFIAVGCLHLPGDKGLIRLLEKQGYTLTPLPIQ